MCDRVSNMEAEFLSFACEENLPLNIIPKLVRLSQSDSKDPSALKAVELGHTSATYKLTHGLAKAKRDSVIECLKIYPFSIKVDEFLTNF